jgi:hypothetical protein
LRHGYLSFICSPESCWNLKELFPTIIPTCADYSNTL